MVREIPLTGGLVALVDDEDYDAVATHTWTPSHRKGRVYVATKIDGRTTYLHQFLLNPPRGLTGDHWDGDGLNNQRHNIRIATYSQNGVNREAPALHGFRGVTPFKGGKWQAGLKHLRKFHHLGVYDDPEQAALAYDDKAREVHRGFARLNFPRPGERYNDGRIAGDDAPPLPPRMDRIPPRLSGYKVWCERERQGMSRDDLATRLGIHRNGVMVYEHGKIQARPDMIHRFATALQVDIETILIEDGDTETIAPIRKWQRKAVA